MVRLVVKLVLAALALNALWQAGSAYSRYYRWQDALQQTAQFAERRSNKDVCQSALDEAEKLDVPVSADSVLVRRGMLPAFNCGTGAIQGGAGPAAASNKLAIEAEYTEDVKLFPGFTRVFEFKESVSAIIRP